MAYDDEYFQDEDANIKIVDLPNSDLDARAAHLLAFGRRMQTLVRTPRLSLIPTLLITMLLLVLLSGSQLPAHHLPTQSSHSSLQSFSFSSIQVFSVNGTPGPKGFVIMNTNNGWIAGFGGGNTSQKKAITTCTAGTQIGAVDSVGSYPVWIKGILGPQAHLALSASTYRTAPWPGWDITLQVAAIYNFNQPITLSVLSAQTGFPAAFTTGQPNIFNTSITLNAQPPAQRNVPLGSKFINIWNVTLHIPQIGCYELMADWTINTWNILFTAQQ